MNLCIIVTGDRNATMQKWGKAIAERLWDATEGEGALLIHGAASGVDTICAATARKLRDVRVVPMPAQWNAHGKAAGPRRNIAMIEVGKQLRDCGYSVQVLAFHDDLSQSKGTRHMVREAKRNGFPVTVYGSDGQVKP